MSDTLPNLDGLLTCRGYTLVYEDGRMIDQIEI